MTKKSRPRRHWYSHKRHHKKGTQVSIPIIVTTAVPLIRAVDAAMPNFQSGDIIGGLKSFMHNACGYYTGYFPLDNHFEWSKLGETYIPIAVAVGIHAFLGKRINPQMKRIPLIGKYIGV